MHVVEILDIRPRAPEPSILWGFNLGSPQAHSKSETYAIKIAGWVLGRRSQVTLIEIIVDNQVIRTVPVRIARTDVAERFPDVEGSDKCGFWTLVGALGHGTNFTVIVQAVFSDQSRLPLAEIQCNCKFGTTSFHPSVHPLLVTSLGRTGTTWLMRLLSQHPEIAIYARHPYEFKFGRYWMNVLRVLCEPANHHQSSHPDSFHENRHFVGHNPFFAGHVAENAALGHWFGRNHIEKFTAFAQRSIEDCYREIALDQGRTNPRFYAEKHLPDQLPRMIMQVYAQVREIILVRDFRDMVCSMLAFNRKRGFASFGRERAESDAEFIGQLKSGVGQLQQSWVERSKSAHLVRYEDLISRPTETLAAIFEYLGLDRTPSLLLTIFEAASRGSPESAKHMTSNSAATSINRWKSDMDPTLTKLCEEFFQNALQTFGYTEP